MSALKTVTVCINRRVVPGSPSCGARGGVEIAAALRAAVAERGLPITVETFYCLGRCAQGPNLKLSPGGEFLHEAHLEDLPRLLGRIAAFAQE